MPTKKRIVNAQDIVNLFSAGIDYGEHDSDGSAPAFLNYDLEKVDALLSRARQEAHAEGRREGLKEMDIAWKTCVLLGQKDTLELSAYRQEYSNQP